MTKSRADRDLEARLDVIQRRLRQLAELDARRAAFGANRHDWATEAPMRAGEIATFEREHAVTLPPDFRRFLERISSSGA